MPDAIKVEELWDDELTSDAVAEIAKRHGILFDRSDPMCVVPLLVNLGVRNALARVRESDGAKMDALRTAMDQMTAASVEALRGEGAALTQNVKEAVRLDLDRAGASAATLVGNIQQAYSRPARVRWVVLGMLLGGLLVGVGIAIGRGVL